ncbi:hypothetical protein [Metamycoplasma hominis]|nr:hypothetical protein [Metamycoplasma hominis]MCZ2781551.1 hypothetical protein [Metamycoplasma hominis]QKX37471.1 hypothetical protein HU154_03005 [Metamycoplasma hominis]
MNDIKNLDWVNAKESKLKKYRHYLKESKLKTKIWQYNKSWFLTRIKC